MSEKVAKGDFVEIEYEAFANGKLFDTNIPEKLKEINPNAKAEKTIVRVGKEMVIEGLDKRLEGKDVGKEYEVEIPPSEAFGTRDRALIKTIPLALFKQHNLSPRAGMTLTIDGMPARVVAVSGARVTIDLNNPLAGKDITYKIKIKRKLSDEKEIVSAVLLYLFRKPLEFELSGEKVIVKGEKPLSYFVEALKPRFKEIVGKELSFSESGQEKSGLESKDSGEETDSQSEKDDKTSGTGQEQNQSSA
ncbi:peptidylprolyl isomerase [Candidatus Pacearchaeota archaeon]|nr:MAG: peptidylprolyl isomerase [Candidatus Pacearchaeota archaeon]